MATIKGTVNSSFFYMLKREYTRHYILMAMMERGDNVSGYPGMNDDDDDDD